MKKTMSEFDSNQITRLGFDDELSAHRMVLVNAPRFTESVNNLDAPASTKIERIEVPVPIKELEIREIHIPVIVKEIEIKEIQVPVIVKETVIERVEVPVIIKESVTNTENKQLDIQVVEKDLPNWIKIVIAAQFLTSILMLLKK
jgi:hypothetical protein